MLRSRIFAEEMLTRKMAKNFFYLYIYTYIYIYINSISNIACLWLGKTLLYTPCTRVNLFGLCPSFGLEPSLPLRGRSLTAQCRMESNGNELETGKSNGNVVGNCHYTKWKSY